jgi:hypothetical protein
MGTAPSTTEVAYLGECVRRSYVSMQITLDRCLDARRALWALNEEAAA